MVEEVKIIHTGDLHLGMTFKSLGKKSKLHRRDCQDVFSNIIDLCINEKVDSLLIAGDLFDKLKPSGKRPETAHQERLNDTNRIFIVHGRDEAAKSSVARFLEKLELKPVILHEQPNQGRTIIEKISDYSDVAFAVVLLTADDKGGLISCSSEELQLRARQNVIFELGYFIGKLERHRVCVLYKKGVEIPSDYKGVLFIPLDDADVWKSLLVKEMKESGIAIDMNKAI